jgi:pimeloyl-ACP methyl ester carboxylesterase
MNSKQNIGLLRRQFFGTTTWGKRVTVFACVFIGMILGAGWTYERIGERTDALAYPPTGVMIAVDHHRLHLHCIGPIGVGPTIVLENGLGGWSQTWGNIQTELAKKARTCAYDRAGYGWSELGDLSHDAISTADQLHSLLHRSAEAAPYLLVGASIGGLYVRMYAYQYPKDIAGLAFLDPSTEDQLTALPQEEYAKDRDKPNRWKEWAARFGYLRLKFWFGGSPPDKETGAIQAHLSAPFYYIGRRRDIDDWGKTDSEVRATGSLGSVPLIVVSAGSGQSPAFIAARHRLHARIAHLSTAGSQQIVPEAAHASLLFNPDHSKYSIAAILNVWEAAKAGTP